MGKINGINQDPSGIVGNIVYRQTKKGTVVAKQPKKASTPRRSEKQMYTRCQLGNVAANFRLFEDRLALGFEDKTAGQSEFNLYIQANYGGQNAVFITKHERLNGACVLAPYQFTRGTLKSVGYGLNADGVLVTNISLGSLVIGNETSVAQLTAAIMQNNTGWEEGDQLTFFYAEQDEDPMTMVPRATMDSWRVILDLQDATPLRNVAPALGYSVVEGRLGMDDELVNAGAAWVHSRDKGDGNIKVGTQRMFVMSDILASYQTTEAWKRSADSYGGVNTKAVYLNPNSGNGSVTTVDYSSVPSANGSSGNGSSSGDNGSSGSNSNSGTSGTSGTGGDNNGGSNSGGSSTGSETGGNTGGNTGSVTPSVPKLTINRSGTGTSTVSVNGEGVSSGAEIAANTEVAVSVTPAEGATPTASLNGNSVTLTESDGVYSGTFQMPSSNATLVINSGGTTGGGSGDMN